MKTDWDLVKTTFITTDKKLTELTSDFHLNYVVVKRHAAAGKWTEARKMWRAKTQEQAAAQRSTEMAADIVQFDQDCLGASRKGIQLINEVLNSIITERPKGKDIKETIGWVEDRNDSIKELGKALNDYQKAGKLAFGESTDRVEVPTININVESEAGKKLTKDVLSGKGTD
jgi:hypothetical protein